MLPACGDYETALSQGVEVVFAKFVLNLIDDCGDDLRELISLHRWQVTAILENLLVDQWEVKKTYGASEFSLHMPVMREIH